MSKNQTIESFRQKYWEYIDNNRGHRSTADLGIIHSRSIDLNVFAEVLIARLSELRSAKNLAKVVIGEFFVENIFLNQIEHTKFLREKNIRYLSG